MRIGLAVGGTLLVSAALLGVARLDAASQPGPAQVSSSGSQFDLVCTGTWHGNDKKAEPFSDRFRIDLSEGSWCREDCKRIFRISAIGRGYLKLSSANDAGQGNSLSIDRVSGELYGRIKMDGLDATTFATCKSTAFTGFPKTRF